MISFELNPQLTSQHTRLKSNQSIFNPSNITVNRILHKNIHHIFSGGFDLLHINDGNSVLKKFIGRRRFLVDPLLKGMRCKLLHQHIPMIKVKILTLYRSPCDKAQTSTMGSLQTFQHPCISSSRQAIPTQVRMLAKPGLDLPQLGVIVEGFYHACIHVLSFLQYYIIFMYQLQNRWIHKVSGVFKLKPLTPTTLLYSLPDAASIVLASRDLTEIQAVVDVGDRRPLALEVLHTHSHHHVLSGCADGCILVHSREVDGGAFHHTCTLSPHAGEQFVNDIVMVGNNVIGNIYNDGSLALWGLTSSSRLHTFKHLHHRYTYKLRRMGNRLLSCGSDRTVKRVDLEKLALLSSYPHSEAVWCADYLSHHEVAAVGLFGELSVWDVRVGSIVQTCPLQGDESSFLVGKDANTVLFGDMNQLEYCDRRKMKEQQLSRQMMLISVEALLLDEQGLIACGRGSDVARFGKTDQILEPLTFIEEMAVSKFVSLSEYIADEPSIQQEGNKDNPNVISLNKQQQQHNIKMENKIRQMSILKYGVPNKPQATSLKAQNEEVMEEQNQQDEDDSWQDELDIEQEQLSEEGLLGEQNASSSSSQESEKRQGQKSDQGKNEQDEEVINDQ